MTGSNGNTPHQNLAHIRGKPLYAEPASLERSKCETHPTKRAWPDPMEAIREAEARSEAAKMAIVAYKCDSCHQFHLCKRANARPGSLVERPEAERKWEVFTKPTAGNADAKRKILRSFLAERTEANAVEIMELLSIGRASVGGYMRELGWHNTRGPHAKWVPTKTAPPAVTVKSPRHLTAVDESMSRHPAAAVAGWRPMRTLDRVRHMPIGDLLDTLEAAGLEVRLQVREI